MASSEEIAEVAVTARTVLEAKHRARETMLTCARRTIQSCAASIRAVHRDEMDRARELIADARAHLDEADAALEGHPDIRYGSLLGDAKKEFTEANLTLAFVTGAALPTATDLRVEIPAYLNGMAEAASELRRQMLDRLRAGDLARAEELLGLMDDVYSVLVTIDYPDAITGGLRRTTDALRAVTERSRGDLTTTLVASRLQASIDSLLRQSG